MPAAPGGGAPLPSAGHFGRPAPPERARRDVTTADSRQGDTTRAPLPAVQPDPGRDAARAGGGRRRRGGRRPLPRRHVGLRPRRAPARGADLVLVPAEPRPRLPPVDGRHLAAPRLPRPARRAARAAPPAGARPAARAGPARLPLAARGLRPPADHEAARGLPGPCGAGAVAPGRPRPRRARAPARVGASRGAGDARRRPARDPPDAGRAPLADAGVPVHPPLRGGLEREHRQRLLRRPPDGRVVHAPVRRRLPAPLRHGRPLAGVGAARGRRPRVPQRPRLLALAEHRAGLRAPVAAVDTPEIGSSPGFSRPMRAAMAQPITAAREPAPPAPALGGDNAASLVESYRRLAEVFHHVLSEQSRDALLERIADSLADLMPYEALHIYEAREEARLLVPTLARTEYEEQVMRTQPRFGEGLTGWAVLHRRPVWTNRAHLDPRTTVVEGTPVEPEAMIVIPLIARGTLKGALNIYRIGEEAAFLEHEFELAKWFGDAAALALDNAEIRARLEHLAQTDSLTGLYNHRFFHDRLRAELTRASRQHDAVAVLM